MSEWFTPTDRKRLLDIDETTFATIAAAAPLLRASADAIVANFYDRVDRIPGLVGIIEAHSTRTRLEGTLRQYILDFAETRLDDRHDQARNRIAQVHDRIDLPIDAYVAQLAAIREVWVEAVVRSSGAKGGIPRERVPATVSALDKMLAYDEGLVCLAFMNTRQNRAEEALEEVRQAQEAQALAQRELDELAGQLAAAAQQASASVEEMAATAEQVAQEVGEASSMSTGAGVTATEGVGAVGEAEAAVAQVDEATRRLNGAAGALEESSEQIGVITDVLKQTAERINLLALNAAIEAARAGDAGRGFAVVADEVRKLAETTQEHLGHANETVSSMQRSIAEVRSAGQGAQEQVGALGEATRSVQVRFGAINEAVLSTSTALETIASASQQVAAAAGETGRASGEVARLAEDVKRVADGMGSKGD